MKEFEALLIKINNKIKLPQPAKSRIMLEISNDLQDTYEYYLKKGFDAQEALRKTYSKFDISDNSLYQLVQIHESGYRKFMNGLSEQGKTFWERVFLTLIFLILFVFGIRAILFDAFFFQASLFIWPVIISTLIAVFLGLKKFYALFIKKDHDVKNLRYQLNTILFFGALSFLIGLYGYLIEMYSIGNFTVLPGGGFIAFVTRIIYADNMISKITEALIKSASLGIVTLLAIIIIALIWFLLVKKIEKIELAETSFLKN